MINNNNNKDTLKELFLRRRLDKRDITTLDVSGVPRSVLDGDARQVVWHLMTGTTHPLTCLHQDCDNTVKWHRETNKYTDDRGGYKQYCSQKCSCSSDITKEKMKATNLKKYGSSYYLSSEASREATKKHNIERYGVENVFASDEIKERIKATNVEKYGVENVANSADIREKKVITNLERYGVDNPSKNRDVQNKRTHTLLDRYGVENIAHSYFHQEKKKQTILERYGVEHPCQSEEVKKKTKETSIERYGVTSPLLTEMVQTKIKQTMMARYGVENIMQDPDRKKKMLASMKITVQSHMTEDTRNILNSENKFREFVTGKAICQAANILDIDKTTIVSHVERYGCDDLLCRTTTYIEKEFEEFLTSIGVQFDMRSRQIISPYELDFYLPEYNIAVEMNGDYWHSDQVRDKTYHHNKWKLCVDRGIHLVQILESDWNHQKEKVKSMMLSFLKRKSTVLGARKLTVRTITGSDANTFLDKYHLQGRTSGTCFFGSFDNDNVMRAVMVIGWTRGNRLTRQLELKRWVTDSYHSYPGLFSKVFKHTQRTLGFDRIISFSMNDWFTGGMYQATGFIKDSESAPSYKYMFEGRWRHKSLFRKSKIRSKLSHLPEVIDMIDSGATEFEVMDYLKILRTWDAGKIKWVWNKSSEEIQKT